VYISVIPTLMYTWHNFDVLGRASNPQMSKFLYYSRFAYIALISLGVIILPQWLALCSFNNGGYNLGICSTERISSISIVVICYFSAACFLGLTIFKAKRLARKKDQLMIQTGSLNIKLIVLHITLLLGQSCLMAYNSFASLD